MKYTQYEQSLRRELFEIQQGLNDKWDIASAIVFLIKDKRNLIEKMWKNEND